jgi:hypothetical protein
MGAVLIRVAAAGVVPASSVTACGTSSPTDGTPHASRVPSGTVAVASESATVSAGCGIYLKGSNVRILVTAPDPVPQCRQFSTDLSQGGQFWTLQPQPEAGTLAPVCVKTYGPNSAEVDDTGSQYEGQSVCSGLLRSGWTGDTGTETSQSAAAASQSAASDAAAQSSAAAAAEAAQLSGELSSLAGAYSTLGSDTVTVRGDLSSFVSDLSSMRGDVATAATDLARVQADARSSENNQDGTTCGDASTVSGDADTVNGDADSLSGDIDGLQPDLTTARGDLTALESALRVVETDQPNFSGTTEVPSPDAVRDRLASARAAIARVVHAVNVDIDLTNTLVATAHHYSAQANDANKCSNDSTAHDPVPHIT